MADDLFTTTSKDFQVVGYHRAVGEAIIKALNKFIQSVGSLLKFTNKQYRRAMNFGLSFFIGVLQTIQRKNQNVMQEVEPTPAPSVSSLYDSISSVMSSASSELGSPVEQRKAAQKPTAGKQSTKLQTPTNNNNAQKATVKSTPLRSSKNLPKTSSRGSLKKKSILTESSSAFDSLNTAAVASSEEENVTVPSTSILAGLLPTLIAGLVFTTAGSMVGYLWSYDWTETASSTASSVYNYFWGEAETETEASMYSSTMDFSGTGEESGLNSGSVPITPDR